MNTVLNHSIYVARSLYDCYDLLFSIVRSAKIFILHWWYWSWKCRMKCIQNCILLLFYSSKIIARNVNAVLCHSVDCQLTIWLSWSMICCSQLSRMSKITFHNDVDKILHLIVNLSRRKVISAKMYQRCRKSWIKMKISNLSTNRGNVDIYSEQKHHFTK